MTTTLNSVTIPDPYDYSAALERMGSMRRSANGTIMVDYFQSAPKLKIKLQWRLLTSTERNTLYTQLNNCVTAARTLVLPDGRSFSVWLDMETEATEILIRDASGYKYNLSASFIEA